MSQGFPLTDKFMWKILPHIREGIWNQNRPHYNHVYEQIDKLMRLVPLCRDILKHDKEVNYEGDATEWNHVIEQIRETLLQCDL